MKIFLVRFFLNFLFLFIPILTIAHEQEAVFKKLDFDNGDKYEGLVLNGLMHGLGELTTSNGTRVISGVWIRGFIFEGEIWNKKYQNFYEGEILKNKKHGYGKLRFLNQSTGSVSYEGMFRNGKKHGKGTYIWKNGDKYIGDWVDDEQTGWGFYKWKSGVKFWGEFDNGFRSGLGQQNWSNGDVYKGAFKKNNREGLGVQYKKNGKHHAGWWKNNKHVTHIRKTTKINRSPEQNVQGGGKTVYHRRTEGRVGGKICHYSDGSAIRRSGGSRCPRSMIVTD